ncbi:hypothetical protein CDEST_15261 [Colletotrichum destructivum]|uniref:Uncharacterized protein n=1 Tax=Colletotrichum destructivum TaxID=34406 RepID=A0AAX4J3X2_9PEZI|nr:hypothetical protein CDEST_15261 [Colletotrichum destructivum]
MHCLSNLKAHDIVAVIIEIVSSSAGRLLTKDEWENFCQACHSIIRPDCISWLTKLKQPFAAPIAPLSCCSAKGFELAVSRRTLAEFAYTSENISKLTQRLDATNSEPINSHVLLQSWDIDCASAGENWPCCAAKGENLRMVPMKTIPAKKTRLIAGLGASSSFSSVTRLPCCAKRVRAPARRQSGGFPPRIRLWRTTRQFVPCLGTPQLPFGMILFSSWMRLPRLAPIAANLLRGKKAVL